MIKIAKVVGLNSDTHAAQLLVVSGQKEFDLYVVVVCQTEDAFTKARFALSEAEELFYSADGSISERFTQTLDKIKESLSEAKEKEVVMVALQDDNQSTKAIYIMHSVESVGERSSTAFLLREGDLTDLCELGQSGQLISGFLKPSDRLLLTTLSLKEILGNQIEKVSMMPLDLIEDEVVGRLPQAEVLPTAAIFLENSEDKEETDGGLQIGESGFSKGRGFRSWQPKFAQLLQILRNVIPRLIPRSRQGLAVLGGIILLIVLAGSVLTYQQKKTSAIDTEFGSYYQQASESFNKARGLKDLDPTSASKSLEEAEKAIASALKIKPNDTKVLGLQKEISLEKGGILKIYENPEISDWLDLGLIKKGLTANRISLSLGKALLIDKTQGSLVLIDLGNKSQKILAGSDKLGQGELAALNGSAAFVYSSDKGITRTGVEDSETTVVAKSDSEWGGVVDLYGFGSNVYLLDSNKNQIYKYVPIENGFSGPLNYLKADTKVDFNQALRMQIDSSVWVLLQSGKIYKFTQGLEEEFNLSGLDRPLSSPRSFFVSDETERIYILDSGNQRIVVTSKTGGYQLQFRSERFGSLNDLIVDEKAKLIYLLDGNRIHTVQLP